MSFDSLFTLRIHKCLRMINDPKSQHFISWTELGASFVVSNVGEFSRSILGSHFKHNNVRLALFSFCLLLTFFLVFKFCTTTEHVRLPQNQQGQSSPHTLPACAN